MIKRTTPAKSGFALIALAIATLLIFAGVVTSPARSDQRINLAPSEMKNLTNHLADRGIGAHLSNDEKRAHLIDLKQDHLIDQVCIKKSCHLTLESILIRDI